MSTLSVASINSLSSAPPVFKNSSGVEKGQLAKMWINFNGKNTIAIRDSFNVSSIVDDGTGQYTINFATAMGNDDYCVAGSIKEFTGTNTTSVVFLPAKQTTIADGYATTKIQACAASYNNNSFYDSFIVNCIVFGTS